MYRFTVHVFRRIVNCKTQERDMKQILNTLYVMTRGLIQGPQAR